MDVTIFKNPEDKYVFWIKWYQRAKSWH
jgi:hypothetical protein